ncbi:MAG: tetratricopeptide repeat protein [Thermodesulfobacteriota bacterium]|nr:tetratricopeptide repeat protein [Thermodesulfobacteriota bacterium]
MPIPASVGFWFHDPVYRLQHGFSHQQQVILTAKRAEATPFVQDNLLVIPLVIETQPQVDVVVHDVDPSLLQKMAPEWLFELQGKILQRFSLIRKIYTDPGTGLYNQRALELLLSDGSCWKSLFLIATVSRRRTIAGGYQKIVQLSSLMEIVTRYPLFYFGQGIFGCVSPQCDRRAALDFSHRLISRLKREKLHRVHIGFSCLTGEQSPDKTLHDCWLALLEAERRGPYSLCDADFLHKRDQHPLSLPSAQVLRRLQRKWRGLARFGLVLIASAGKEDLPDLEPLLPATSYCVALPDDQQFVLLPGCTGARTAKLVKELTGKIENSIGLHPAMGFSHWPSTGSSKVDCVRNCRKAILHGNFYGTDAVVGFDFLSLNVSGDLYFDEGNYKQAIREYRTGLKMQPGDINLLNSLGVALAEVNRHREAIDCFSQVLEYQADNHMALVNKGMSCRLIGRDDEAVHCFEKALQCTDHMEQASLELYLQLSKLYCMQEQYDNAVVLLNQWQEAKGAPEEFMFFRLMGEACMGAGRNRDAIQALQHSLQLHPRNAESLSMLGLLYVLEGQGAEVGLSLCVRAIGMDETEAEYYYRLASALFHLERFNEALPAVRSALKIRRNHDRAVLLRGRIYEGLGSVYQARQSYQRVVAMKAAGHGRKKQAWARLKKISVV